MSFEKVKTGRGRRVDSILQWLKPPPNLLAHFWMLVPLAASQVLQRFFHVIDNRYINQLGTQALLLHNIQYNFIILGQALGAATATSCLIFWKRQESATRQGSVATKHLLFSGGVASFFAIFLSIFSRQILTHFEVPADFLELGKTYFMFGIANMVLQSLYGSLDGMLIASGQQKRSMILALVLVLGNWAADVFAVHGFHGSNSLAAAITAPLYIVGGSTTILISLVGSIALISVIRKVDGWELFPFQSIFHVWWAEAGLGLVRSVSPLIYAYQLGMLKSSSGFIVTYQLALHVAYLFCLPFLAGTQLAVREAAADIGQKVDANRGGVPVWWNPLLYTALLPTTALLAIGVLFPVPLLSFLYRYATPVDQQGFLSVFYFACLIGQMGNILLIPLRAAKRNIVVTRNMLFAEFGVLLGGTQALIFFRVAAPNTICWITVAYSLTHLVLNANSLRQPKIPKVPKLVAGTAK